jgi:hypothetical protein
MSSLIIAKEAAKLAERRLAKPIEDQLNFIKIETY